MTGPSGSGKTTFLTFAGFSGVQRVTDGANVRGE